MMRIHFFLALLELGFLLQDRAFAADGPDPHAFLDLIQAPSNLQVSGNAKPVTVAIVDDGVRVSHRYLKPFIWRNPKEIPDNRVDDDGNGFVDDVAGWDISDGDADVAPPSGREEMFYHGTHLGGIVTQVARRVYGEDAPKWIRILPVKCLADDADKPYLKDGYKGIQYAVDMHADIILAAWGVAHLSPSEQKILESARQRGSLVVSAAGNFPEEREQFPAAFPPVLAVSSVEADGAKLERANYGAFVDLVAPGAGIASASSASDNEEWSKDGTSMSAAMVAAAAAVIKVQHPGASPEEVVACLKNTAQPVEQFQSEDIQYAGKLGAGRLNLADAARFALEVEPAQANSERHNHQGYLASCREPNVFALWRMRTLGEVSGFWFDPKWSKGEPGQSRLKLFQASALGGAPFLDLKFADWNEKRFVPGIQAVALFEPDEDHPDFKFLVEYASKPINQSELFCKETVRLNAEGIVEDGSGPAPYSPRSSCKWLITAPAGKVIHIKFLEFDTESNVDWLYFFDGAGTHEKIMAAFSGPNLPPELTTWRNQTLLWFVTNDAVQGKGWKAQVTFQEPSRPKNEQP